jgi:hypothetical protein
MAKDVRQEWNMRIETFESQEFDSGKSASGNDSGEM